MSDEPPVLDADVVPEDVQPAAGHALVATVQAPALAVTPQVEAKELVKRLDTIREAMHSAMEKDVDYGVIPGANKPSLYKPGAEKLGVLFQLDIQLRNEKRWSADHLTVESTATVFHAPSGARLGFGEGMCSTREKKYAYRQAERVCPACGMAAIIKGKKEYGGGWLCWKKKDGCGAKYDDGDQAIESQEAGQVDNPDLPDLWNTVVKMAEKRARVDAVLAVTGASAIFTQDIEDQQPPDAAAAPESDLPVDPPAADSAPVETIDPGWATQILDKIHAKGLTLGEVRALLGLVYGSRTAEWDKALIERGVGMLSPGNARALEEELAEREDVPGRGEGDADG